MTNGGSVDAAYRIAVALQGRYQKRFRVFVPGMCKSAGTLIAVGAHELVMSEHGELGPLDVQLGYGGSGLNVSDALEALNDLAFAAFDTFYEELIGRYEGLLSHTAVEVAKDLTINLYSPVYARIDPMYIGESYRAMMVASYYGQRLLKAGRNIDEDGLKSIIWDYVSHEYVINRQEAGDLFHAVDEPDNLETELACALGELALEEVGEEPIIDFLATGDGGGPETEG